MSDLEGESGKKQGLFEENQHTEKLQPLVCSKGQALCVTSVVLAVLVTISLIAAFARPFPRCTTVLEGNNGHMSASSLASSTSHPIPTAVTGEIFPWHDVRLPSFIRPSHYSLFMHPNLTTFVNRGRVNITFFVTQETEFVVLHMKEMAIQHLSVMDDEGEDVRVISYLEYPPHEQLYVEFVQSLEPMENYTLTVHFSKELEEKLEGFYISSYNTAHGEKRDEDYDEDDISDLPLERHRYVAATHFEATFARSAFPCFDEPALKATFQLQIVHDNYHDAYFNSEKISEVDYEENQKLSTFENTVQMSTYLVAFVVCDFKSIGKTTSEGIEVQVLAPAEQLEQARFALETAVDILEYFQDFFNVTYPLKKLDLIAVPDFGPGAMENWGFITFRTTAVLFDPEQSSITSKESIATIIAHELAHQWFGNLVTMYWWNDLWLNEGFASFMENFGVDFIRPEWKMMDQFVLFTTQDALSLDSLESTHPILEDVKNPAEIEAIFDTISYKKGSSIILMLENFLGTDLLREGLTLYLNRYRFKNAQTEDLWNAFSEVTPASAHLNVAAIMKTWTEQKGFPLVTVKVRYRKVHLGQCRFLITTPEEDDASIADISPFGYKWYIPVTYITNDLSEPNLVWLNMTNGDFVLSDHAVWVKVNVNQTGFYRVMYDEENWKNLIEALHTDHMQLSAADRSSLIDDAMVLSRVGILNSTLALDLTKYLKKERDYVPWETAILHFDALRSLMEDSPRYHLLEKYVLKLLKPMLDNIGWEDEGSHLDRKLRSSLLSAAFRFDDDDVIKEATAMFESWKTAGTQVPPNLRHVVYAAGIRHGDKGTWDFCWEQYLNAQVPSEKHLLLMALGQTRDIWQLTQYLSAVLEKDKIRPQDVPSVITVAAHNPIGRLLTWRFMRNHWSDLLEMFGETSFSLDVIISETVSQFQTEFDYKEVQSFFGKVHTGTGALAVKQSLEKIHSNIRWHSEVQPAVIQWLQKHVH